MMEAPGSKVTGSTESGRESISSTRIKLELEILFVLTFAVRDTIEDIFDLFRTTNREADLV